MRELAVAGFKVARDLDVGASSLGSRVSGLGPWAPEAAFSRPDALPIPNSSSQGLILSVAQHFSTTTENEKNSTQNLRADVISTGSRGCLGVRKGQLLSEFVAA